jgi:hypothetical protein
MDFTRSKGCAIRYGPSRPRPSEKDFRMKRYLPVLTVGAALIALSGCYYYGDRYGYYHRDYGYGPYAHYNAYYDGYYGPYGGGYWGSDGYFYYTDSGRRYRRDTGRHFRRERFEGSSEYRTDRDHDYDRGRGYDRGRDYDRRRGRDRDDD